MTSHNAKNERIKRRYLSYLREAERYSEASVDSVAAAFSRFESYNRYRDFDRFHQEQAVAFKRHLAGQASGITGRKLSKATQYTVLMHLKRFFHWLAGQPGYKSRLRYSDAEYFNMAAGDSRVATARRRRPVPTLEQIKHVIATIPTGSDIERRNRAVIALTLLTGARDSAIASFKLKHVDLESGCVHQDARDVRTKFSKTFTTFFFPVGKEIRQIVVDWISLLRKERLWGDDDPLFPRTKVRVGASGSFEAAGLDREHWTNATPIREIFKHAFAVAGLPYFNPHSFRNALVSLAQRLCRSPEQFKAWSQNLGHEDVLTTFYSYGAVEISRQGALIHSLAGHDSAGMAPADLERLFRQMQSPAVLRALSAATQ